MTKTNDEIIRSKLIKRYYALVRKLDLDDIEADWLKQHVGKSPYDMDNETLTEYCLKFERLLNPNNPETETLRKKVIEIICNWLSLYGLEKNAELAKIIAIKESGFRYFDEISPSKLRGICRQFNKRANDFIEIEKLIANLKIENNASNVLSDTNQ